MAKKYSTLRAKLRERLTTEGKLTRTYKRREPGEVKDSSRVTRESLITRHQYCVSVDDILREKARALRLGLRYDMKDQDIKGVCNHPNDGVCGTDFSDTQVKEVNARLSGAEEPELKSQKQDLEIPVKKSSPPRRRSRKTKAEKPLARYYCTRCQEFHTEGKFVDYFVHQQWKRGRGRPRK